MVYVKLTPEEKLERNRLRALKIAETKNRNNQIKAQNEELERLNNIVQPALPQIEEDLKQEKIIRKRNKQAKDLESELKRLIEIYGLDNAESSYSKVIKEIKSERKDILKTFRNEIKKNNFNQIEESYEKVAPKYRKQANEILAKDVEINYHTDATKSGVKKIVFDGFGLDGKNVNIQQLQFYTLGLFNDRIYDIIDKEIPDKAIDIQICLHDKNGKSLVPANINTINNFKKFMKTFLLDTYEVNEDSSKGEEKIITAANNLAPISEFFIIITFRRNNAKGIYGKIISGAEQDIISKHPNNYVVVDCKEDCIYEAVIRAYIDGFFENEPSKNYKYTKILIPSLDDSQKKRIIPFPEYDNELVYDDKNKSRCINTFLKSNLQSLIDKYKNICGGSALPGAFRKPFGEKVFFESSEEIIGRLSKLLNIEIFTFNKLSEYLATNKKKDKEGKQILTLYIVENNDGSTHCNYIKNVYQLFGGHLCLKHMNTSNECRECLGKKPISRSVNHSASLENASQKTFQVSSKLKESKDEYKIIYWDIETIRTPLTDTDKNLVFKSNFRDVNNECDNQRSNMCVLSPAIVCMKYIKYSYNKDTHELNEVTDYEIPIASGSRSFTNLNSVTCFIGFDCIEKFINHLFETKEYHSRNTILYAHNSGKFDNVPILEHFIYKRQHHFKSSDIINSNGRFVQIKFSLNENCTFVFRDSLSHIASSLKSACKTFGATPKREVIPYKWFNKNHMDNYLNGSEEYIDYKTLDKSYFDLDSIEELNKCNKWLVKPFENYLEYCTYDVIGLSEMFYKYAKLINEKLTYHPLPFDYLTINSMGYNCVIKSIEEYNSKIPDNKKIIDDYEKNVIQKDERKKEEIEAKIEELQTDNNGTNTEALKDLRKQLKYIKQKIFYDKQNKPLFGPDKINQFNQSRLGKNENLFMEILLNSKELRENLNITKEIKHIDQQYKIVCEPNKKSCKSLPKARFIDFVINFYDGTNLPIEYYENAHYYHQEEDNERIEEIKKYGNFEEVKIVWECDFLEFLEKYKKEHAEEFNRIEKRLSEDKNKMNPRDSLAGGRCETHAHYFKSGETGYGLIKQDFSSLYPSVCYNCYLPMGDYVYYNRNENLISTFENKLNSKMEAFKEKHKKISEGLDLLNTEDPKNLNLMGLFSALCKVYPPKNLLRPVVGAKINNKFMFVLCRKCAEENKQFFNSNQMGIVCNHSEEERSFLVTLNSPDIYAALYLGYQIKILDMYTIGKYSNQAFRPFIQDIYTLKFKASGKEEVKPENVEFLNKLGFNIKYDDVYEKKNAGLRQIAKLIINACSFGKFAESFKKSGIAIINNTGEYITDYLANYNYDIKDRIPLGDNKILVSYDMSDNSYSVDKDNTSCFIGSFITSYARIQLYRFINYLQEDPYARKMVYCDTDCAVYEYKYEQLKISVPKYFSVISGSLGIDSELKNIHDYIKEWVSLGPKCYIAVDNHDNIIGFSCKGISRAGKILLNPFVNLRKGSSTEEKITSGNPLFMKSEQKKLFDIFKQYVLSNFDSKFAPEFKLEDQFMKSSVTFKLYQFDTIKKLNTTEFKRVVLPKDEEGNIFTVPFGYKPL